MESLARRGVRTTVAVAGLAALGVGLAAPAFAAPERPGRERGRQRARRTRRPTSWPGSSSEFTKASDALAKLPGKFNFEMPTADSTTVPSDAERRRTGRRAPDAATPDAAAAATPSTDPTSALPTALPSLPVGTPNVQATRRCRTSTRAAPCRPSTRQACSAEVRARKRVL